MATIFTQEQSVMQKRILTNRLSKKSIRNGVTTQGRNLQVTADANLVYIDFGSAYINGSIFTIEDDGTSGRFSLALPLTTPMAYRVVLRKEYINREVTIQPILKEGTDSRVPELARIHDGIWELSLAAIIRDENGVVVIDERFDDTVCGFSEVELDGNELMDMMYPVGSIYMTANPLNPSNLFGGTWERWGEGQVPVGVKEDDIDFSTPDKEGGEKVHKLTIAEMPNHAHTIKMTATNVAINPASFPYPPYTNRSPSEFDADPINRTGGGQPHNNLQPYVTCYMFKRIA